MISTPNVNDFNKLIEPNLNGGKVVSTKYRYLTQPGDNYGSTMLGVTVNVQNKTGTIEQLEIVAKLPPSSELFWKMFQPERTFVTENCVYIEMVPEFEQLQKDVNISEKDRIDVFPKCYGARISLDEQTKILDKNATLLLENLYSSGYKVGVRNEGFDYEHSKVILKHLAQFHALPIALRLLKPKVFEEKCRPHLKRFSLEVNMDKEVSKQMREECYKSFTLMPDVTTDEEITKLINSFNYCDIFIFKKEECSDDLFTTISHCDFWVNNMMIQYDESGKPNKVKILDFQVAQYESLIHDLIFFLFTSVRCEILSKKFNEFLEFYYKHFIETLKMLGCSIEEYSMEKFLEEVENVAPLQFSHIVLMLRVLYVKKEDLPNFDNLDMDCFSQETSFDESFYRKLKNVCNSYFEHKWIVE